MSAVTREGGREGGREIGNPTLVIRRSSAATQRRSRRSVVLGGNCGHDDDCLSVKSQGFYHYPICIKTTQGRKGPDRLRENAPIVLKPVTIHALLLDTAQVNKCFMTCATLSNKSDSRARVLAYFGTTGRLSAAPRRAGPRPRPQPPQPTCWLGRSVCRPSCNFPANEFLLGIH